MQREPDHAPQGALQQADGSVLWRVWAPLSATVALVTYPPAGRVETGMVPESEGYFVLRDPAAGEGLLYAYRLADGREYPDPATRWQPDGVHRSSAVFFPQSYRWSDAAWRGVAREDLVIYELHVGAFTPEGTFDALMPRLPQLAALGVTAIELMPVAQFPGDRNWGYDGVHPYAVQNSYGGPRALQRLVDAAHRHGLAVLLDVVYNHLGPEGNYLAQIRAVFHRPLSHALGQRRSTTTVPTATRCGSSSSTTPARGCATSTSTACGSTRCRPCTTSARGTSSPRSRPRCRRRPRGPAAPSTSSPRATRTTSACSSPQPWADTAWTGSGATISTMPSMPS